MTSKIISSSLLISFLLIGFSTFAQNPGYHDLTSRYNYIFNSKLKLKESLLELEKNQTDDYEQLLQVEKEGTKDDKADATPNMDEVIKKSSAGIQLHGISKWVDEHYLLIGKANYYKGEHKSSLENLKYVLSEFTDKKRILNSIRNVTAEKEEKTTKNDKMSRDEAAARRALDAKRRKKSSDKKRKDRSKEKDKAKKAKDKARAASRKGKEVDDENAEEEAPEIMNAEVIAECKLFILKNYIAMGDDSFVSEMIAEIEADLNFSENLKKQFLAAKSQYYLNKNDFESARATLTQLIDVTGKSSERARSYYILGQINEIQNNYAEANKSFRKAFSSSPDYDMEFNAELKMAETSIKSSPSTRARAIRSIQKMIKDDKNEEYFGKLNYTLGMIYLNSDEETKAINAFKEAVKTSGAENATQKGYAFLRLAEIYFNNEEYIRSSNYYDSTMVVIPTTIKEYTDIKSRQEILRELALQIKIVNFEDSLQTLAKMSEAKRNKVLDGIIEKFEETASLAAEKETEEDNFKGLDKNKSKKSTSNKGGSFYFYNETQKTRGYNKFKEKFGDRALTDNWRVKSISESAGISFAVLGDNAEEEILELAKKGELNRNLLLAQLPLTKEALEISNEAIVEALYNAGNIYRNDLNNNDKAIDTFNELVERFPLNAYEVETFYQLYLLYTKAGEKNKASTYKLKIERKYPYSVYAKLIENPNFLLKPGDEFDSPELFYNNSFALYNEGEYEEVVARCEAVVELFPENEIQGKYDFLRAQALSKIDELNVYVSALTDVVSNYPSTDVEKRSKEILAAIAKSEKGKNKNSKSDKAEEKEATKEIAKEETKKTGTKKEVEKVKYDKNKSAFKDSKTEKHFFIIRFNEYHKSITKVLDELSVVNKDYFATKKYKINQMVMDKNNQLAIVKTFDNGAEAMKYYERVVKEETSVFAQLEAVEFTYFPVSKTNFAAFFKTKGLAEYIAFFNATYLNE